MNAQRLAVRVIAFALLCAGAGLARADDTRADETAAASAASLRAGYVAMQRRLSHNQFHRALYLDSSEAPGAVTGDIHALVNSPFESAGAAVERYPRQLHELEAGEYLDMKRKENLRQQAGPA